MQKKKNKTIWHLLKSTRCMFYEPSNSLLKICLENVHVKRNDCHSHQRNTKIAVNNKVYNSHEGSHSIASRQIDGLIPWTIIHQWRRPHLKAKYLFAISVKNIYSLLFKIEGAAILINLLFRIFYFE